MSIEAAMFGREVSPRIEAERCSRPSLVLRASISAPVPFLTRAAMPHVAANAGKTRKILIYGINYTPEIIGVGRFTGEIGAYLAKNGFDVCVVTAPPHYPGWRAFPPYSARRYASETRAGVKILRCPLLLRADIHGIWRLIAPFSFALTSAPVVLWKI